MVSPRQRQRQRQPCGCCWPAAGAVAFAAAGHFLEPFVEAWLSHWVTQLPTQQHQTCDVGCAFAALQISRPQLVLALVLGHVLVLALEPQQLKQAQSV